MQESTREKRLEFRYPNLAFFNVASVNHPPKGVLVAWEGASRNMWWDFIAKAWWDTFHRTPSDPLYTCLIWNATLRRVL